VEITEVEADNLQIDTSSMDQLKFRELAREQPILLEQIASLKSQVRTLQSQIRESSQSRLSTEDVARLQKVDIQLFV